MYCPHMLHPLLLHLTLSALYALQPHAQDIPVPLQVIPSLTHYGPDGPWQAVAVGLGTPIQNVDLYPGSTFETILLAKSTCSSTAAVCGSGGLYDPSSSSTIDNTSIVFTGHSYGDTVDWTIGAMLDQGHAIYVMDELTIGTRHVAVPNISIRMMKNVSMTYPDGTMYPLQVGQLALGASVANQSFSESSGKPSVNATLAPNYLQKNEIIPTSSYGMHIGSAAFNLPLSLWLGGYDLSRVLGPVSAQPYSANIANNNFIIDLLDIGVGVDHGGSPWPYRERDGLLAEKNSSINSVSVAMNSAAPYMYLPNSTCTALTQDLPVTYSAKYGLYLWNVSDPQYAKIITAPTYLSFIFRTTAQNLTIKVPFQLLNLTLDAPLIDTPTTYFPCTTPQDSPSYSLGRAFLQAAFIGVDWDEGLGQWFLAQAPGPNTASIPSQTAITGTKLNGSENDWAETWRPYWTALPTANQLPPALTSQTSLAKSTNTPLPSHLLPGASAGIGVGAAFLVLALFTGSIYCYRRKRRRNQVPAQAPWTPVDAKPNPNNSPPTFHEAPVTEPVHEVAGRQHMAHELGAGEQY